MEVELLNHQWKTLHNESKYLLLISGVGGGKTFTGVHWCINKCQTHPKSLGFIGANTFAQLRNSTLSAVFNELSRMEISFSYNQSSGILNFLGKNWLCKSLDNYDGLRGIEIGEFWLDEAAYSKHEAFQVITGRLRDKKGSLQGLITTTPKGFNWVYDYFHPSGELNNPDYRMIKATSMDNKFLPEGYLDALKSQYDEKLIQQELQGEFISLAAGQAYYAFEREVNVKEVNKPERGAIYIGSDYNVDPMTCCIGYISNNSLYIFDEVFDRNSDTQKVCHILNKKGYRTGMIIPDSTGKNRKTSGHSDFEILKQNGFKIMDTLNPYVIDRVNNINRLLSQGRIIIDPKCKKLINDLEKVTWKDGKLDQKTDKLLTHISDSLGYMAWKLMPIEVSGPRMMIRNR